MHDGEPAGVGLDRVGVGRELAGDIRDEVGGLGQPGGQGAERPVVDGGGLKRVPRGAEQRERVGGVEASRVADQRLVGGGRGAVQGVGVGEPLGLGGQFEVLAVGRLEPLELGEPGPQVVGLPGALAGEGGEFVQFRAYLEVLAVDPLVVAQQAGELGPANRSSAARCLPGLSNCC